MACIRCLVLIDTVYATNNVNLYSWEPFDPLFCKMHFLLAMFKCLIVHCSVRRILTIFQASRRKLTPTTVFFLWKPLSNQTCPSPVLSALSLRATKQSNTKMDCPTVCEEYTVNTVAWSTVFIWHFFIYIWRLRGYGGKLVCNLISNICAAVSC